MNFAEISLDTWAGGGVTGMLVVVMTEFLRRTKDTDERRDAASKMVMDAAMEREARAWAERDRALLERDAAREEGNRLRGELEELRRRTSEGSPWATKPPDPTPGPDAIL